MDEPVIEKVYDSSIIPICDECADKPELTRGCIKCGREYCHHNASKVEPRMCDDCTRGFNVIESIITKTVEITNSNGEVISKRMQHATHIGLEGMDWLFTARKILEMDEHDLENTIEYHRAVASIMLQERENRRTERINKLAAQKIVIPKRETQFEKEERDRKNKEREEKRLANGGTKRTSTKKSSAPSMEDLANMLGKLAKSGLTMEQIIAMAGKK